MDWLGIRLFGREAARYEEFHRKKQRGEWQQFKREGHYWIGTTYERLSRAEEIGLLLAAPRRHLDKPEYDNPIWDNAVKAYECSLDTTN